MNNTDKSTAGSYSSTPDDHESLGVDHDWVPVAQAPSLDTGSSNMRSPCKWGVPSE